MNYDDLKITEEVLLTEGKMITLSSNFLVPTKIFTNTNDGEDYGDKYCADVYSIVVEERMQGSLFFKPYTDASLNKTFTYKGIEVLDLELQFAWSRDAENEKVYEYNQNFKIRTADNKTLVLEIPTRLPNRNLMLAMKVFFIEIFNVLDRREDELTRILQ
jgi:hypothetical protein